MSRPRAPDTSGPPSVFDASAFVSIRVVVEFRNLTSQAAVLPAEQCSIDEIGVDAITLGLPAKSCQLNHSVAIQVLREDPRDPQRSLGFQATGKIEAVEPADARSRIRARVALIQVDEAVWKRFLDLSDAQQRAINHFMQSAKG